MESEIRRVQRIQAIEEVSAVAKRRNVVAEQADRAELQQVEIAAGIIVGPRTKVFKTGEEEEQADDANRRSEIDRDAHGSADSRSQRERHDKKWNGQLEERGSFAVEQCPEQRQRQYDSESPSHAFPALARAEYGPENYGSRAELSQSRHAADGRQIVEARLIHRAFFSSHNPGDVGKRHSSLNREPDPHCITEHAEIEADAKQGSDETPWNPVDQVSGGLAGGFDSGHERRSEQRTENENRDAREGDLEGAQVEEFRHSPIRAVGGLRNDVGGDRDHHARRPKDEGGM